MNSTFRHSTRAFSGIVFFFALALRLSGSATAEEIDTRPLDVKIERAFPNLEFVRPILLTHAGDGSNRIFVPSQLGKVHVFPNKQDVKKTKVFLDLEGKVEYKDRENEEGVLGMAFHPKFKTNGELFVYYTAKATKENPHLSVISRFKVSKDDPDRADPKSEEILLTINQPYWNHNGGTIAFGPDGYLYVGLGDGGLANDPHGNGQNKGTMLGKILRIDVDHKDEGKKYAVPKDNPFIKDKDAAPEIWALGLRNVWRMAFDRKSKLLWAADVGQDWWEEINIIERGGNYGWNKREAMHTFKKGAKGVPADTPAEPLDPDSKLIDPIFEYHHDIGKSITGGNVYRGKAAPELIGKYIYADYIVGKVWALAVDDINNPKTVIGNHPIPGNVLPIMTFGEDEKGETYFANDAGSTKPCMLYRFVSGKQQTSREKATKTKSRQR